MGRFRRSNNDDDNQEKPSSRRFGRSGGDDDKKDDDKKPSRRFGRSGGDDDKKDDSTSSGRRLGASSGGSSSDSPGGRTFGASRGGGGDDKSDDGGRRTPFGSGGDSSGGSSSSPFSRGGSDSGGGRTFGSSRGADTKPDDKKSSSSSFGRSSGDSGGGATSGRFGSRGGDTKPDDKKTSSSRFGRSSDDSGGGATSGRFGSRGGDTKPDDKKTSSSRFGRSSGDSGGASTSGRFGARGGDDKKDDKKTSSSRFGRSSGDSGGTSTSGRFGSRGGDPTPDDKKSSSSSFGRSSGDSGGTSTSGRFGSRGGDTKPDDKKTGSSRFGRSSGSPATGAGAGSDTSGGRTFGARQGSASDSDSGGRTFGSSRTGGTQQPSAAGGRTTGSTSSRFGRGDDKKDDKPASSGRFGRGGDDKKDDKPASSGRFGRGGDDKKDDKSASSGRFGRGGDDKKDDKKSGGGRFGRGGDDKKDAKPASATGRFSRGQSDDRKSDKSSDGGGVFGRFRRGGDDAKKDSRAKASSNKRDLPKQKGTARNVTTGLDLDRKLDIAGFMMLAVGVFLGLGWLQAMTSSTDVQGITGTVDKIMAQLFGDGRVIVAVTLIYIGGWLILRFFGTMFDIDYYRLAGRGLMFIAILTTLQWWNLLFLEFPGKINYVPDLESLQRQSDQLWQDGGGGGVIGHELYMLLMNFNDYGVVVMLVFAWILSLYLGFELSLERVSNYVIATRNARAIKRAERAAQQPEPEPVEEKLVQQPVSQPALATATAGAGTATVEEKPQRSSLFGRGGRKQAPSTAPITAETDGDAPQRAIAAEKQTAGRVQAPSNTPITADTDGTPQRRRLFGRGGRKEAPQPAAENTVTVTSTTAKVEEKSDQPQRRGLFGRKGRDQETGQIETLPVTAPTTTNGRRAPVDTGTEDAGSNPQGRRLGGLGGRRQDEASVQQDAVVSPTATPELARTPSAADTPARRSAASTDTPAGGRRQAPPVTTETPATTTAQADTGGQATDLQPAFTPPTTTPVQSTRAKAETRKFDADADTTTEAEAKDKSDVVTAAVTGAIVAATTETMPKSADQSAAEKVAPPAADKSATPTAETPKPVTPAESIKEEVAETLVDEQPVPTAQPRGIFKRDENPITPARPEVKPAPKLTSQPTEASATQTIATQDNGAAIPAAGLNKPIGMSDSAFAAVSAATAPAAELAAQVQDSGKSKAEQAEEELEEAKAEATSGRWRHPDFLKLLEEGSEQKIEQQILLQRAQTIEDTLISFGAPGKVVEVNTGPVITQFGIEPDYIERRNGSKSRVKVSAIAGLEKDIALALAAKAIRIEAPVPGKGYVGIEVPNAEAAVVSLRDVMMSEHHKKKVKKSKLSIGLGRKVDGEPVTADLTSMPHLLIAGATGSGKSVCVNAIIACLLLQNTPEELQFIMVDPKRVELAGYNGIPHLVSPVVVDLERIVGVLKWVQREMDDRYRRFANVGARNIVDYNENKLPTDTAKLPYLVVIVDELADLMMLAPDETERLIARLAQMARATGIHLIISTQRPSVDVVTGLIKANFPARIAFAVASSVDSRVIIDQPGAEKLLGRGDMLFQAPDAPAPTRMQGAYLSDLEINRITHYWKSVQAIKEKNGSSRKSGTLVTEGQNIPQVQSRSERFRRDSGRGSGGRSSGNQQQDFWDAQPTTAPASPRRPSNNGDGEDDLLEQAVELVRQQNRASIAMLQRNFRIGHDRATRLMQILEEKGIVKAEVDATAVREVLPPKPE